MIDISIVITNYNYGKYLGRCIRSCLKQSAKNFEIIVVDDKSTDNSREVISAFNGYVKAIYLSEHQGVAETSNRGIRIALGAFVIRVDADDYIQENALSFMSEILFNNPDIGFVYSDHIRVDKKEEQKVKLDTLEKIYRHGAGIMFRKSNLEAIGLYDKKLENAEDYDLLKRYLKNFNGYRIPIPFYRYYQHKDNMTKDDKVRKNWEAIADKKYESR